MSIIIYASLHLEYTNKNERKLHYILIHLLIDCIYNDCELKMKVPEYKKIRPFLYVCLSRQTSWHSDLHMLASVWSLIRESREASITTFTLRYCDKLSVASPTGDDAEIAAQITVQVEVQGGLWWSGPMSLTFLKKRKQNKWNEKKESKHWKLRN